MAAAGAEGVVGHNGPGIVNIGFYGEAQLEGERGEISIERARLGAIGGLAARRNRFSILVCHIRFSEVLSGRYMSLVTL